MWCITKTKQILRNRKLREQNLILEELNISIEQITLSNMNPFNTKLMNKLNNSRSNSSFPNSRNIRKRTNRRFILQNNTVKFRHINLISGGTRRNIECETVTGEDRVNDLENEGFDVGLNGGEGEIRYFAAFEGE